MTSFIKIMHLLRKYGNKYSISEIVYLTTHWLFDNKYAKILRRYGRFVCFINHKKIIFAYNH